MSATVLIVGPGTVTGPHPVPDEMVCAAIAAIDDECVLHEERPVPVTALWSDIIAAAVGAQHPRRLLLVCPGWWSDARVRRLRRAADPHCVHTTIQRRHEVCRPTPRCVIEIAPEFVLCRFADSPVAATPRLGSTAEVAGTVARAVIGRGPVVIDAPSGVAGSAELAAALADDLGAQHVRIVDDTALAAALADRPRPAVIPVRRATLRAPAALMVIPAVVTLGAALLLPRAAEPPARPTTVLAEGRVTLRIPAGWVTRRVTEGAGSPRIEVFAPGQDVAAILLTQSVGGPDLTNTAAVLAAALRAQPAGVFSGLRTDDHQGGRAVLSYTETRTDREIGWAVFLDGRVRIAIGCRQPATGPVIREHCDEAIRSAHAEP